MGATQFGRELRKDSDWRIKRERMRFVKDSLQVEFYKQSLNDSL